MSTAPKEVLHVEAAGQKVDTDNAAQFGDPTLALEAIENLLALQAHFKGDTNVAAALAAAATRSSGFSLPAFVAQTLNKFYRRLAFVVLRRKLEIVAATVVLVAVGILSWQLLLKYEDESAKLWTPTDSPAYSLLQDMDGDFGDRPRLQSALFHGNGRNILTKDFLKAALDFHHRVGTEAMYVPYCYRPSPTSECVASSILDAWAWSRQIIDDDPDLHSTFRRYWEDARSNATEGWKERQAPVWNRTDNSLIALRATRMVWAYRAEPVDTIMSLEDVFVDLFRNEWGREHPDVTAEVVAVSSAGKEIARIVEQDIALVGISIVLVLFFCAAVLGDRTLVGSRFLLGGMAIILMLMAFVVGIGILALTGEKETPITPLVLFVLIGIGVDDCIIIVDAHSAHHFVRDPVRRISRSLAVAGPAITLTTITDLLAFAFGSLAAMPAVRSFTITALFVILVDFVLQVSVFLIGLEIDQRRVNSNRMDVLFCLQLPGRYTTARELVESACGPKEPESTTAVTTSAAAPVNPLAGRTHDSGDGEPPDSAVAVERPLMRGRTSRVSFSLPAGQLSAARDGGTQKLSTTPSMAISAVTGKRLNVGTLKRQFSRRASQAAQRRASDMSSAAEVWVHAPVVASVGSTPLDAPMPGVGPPRLGLDVHPRATPPEGTLSAQATTPTDKSSSPDLPPVPDIATDRVAVPAAAKQRRVSFPATRETSEVISAPDPVATSEPDDPFAAVQVLETGDHADEDENIGVLQRCLRDCYAPVVTHRIGRTAIIVTFLGWMCFCAAMIPNIEKGLCDTCVLPEDSYIRDYVDARDKFFGTGTETVYIVIDDDRVDWTTRAALEAVEFLRLDLERLSAIQEVSPWIHSFMAWTEYRKNVAAAAGSEEWDRLQDVYGNFYWLLDAYHADRPEAATQVVRNSDGVVVKSRSHATQVIVDDTFDRIDNMRAIRRVWSEWSAKTGVNGYVVSDSWPFSDGDAAIEQMIYDTLWLSCVAVFVALLMFVSPYIALLITINVAFIDISILGWMYLVQIPMSPVSYIVIAMSVGMAVDYCAHVGIAFANCRVNKRSMSRASLGGVLGEQDAAYYTRLALEEIGASVFAGGTSTLLGVVALSGASSATFFTFFLMLFGTVLFGMLHGFVFFPAVLACLPDVLVRKTVIQPFS